MFSTSNTQSECHITTAAQNARGVFARGVPLMPPTYRTESGSADWGTHRDLRGLREEVYSSRHRKSTMSVDARTHRREAAADGTE